jgi:hypothetical protein
LNAELTAEECHDSELGDIYDLYNACNGEIVNGLLDVSKLDEYGPEDAEALNVPRLRRVWGHMASGCSECETIVRGLRRLRESLAAAAN